MDREFSKKRVKGETELNEGQVFGWRVLRIEDGPEIAADPAFWLKNVSTTSEERW